MTTITWTTAKGNAVRLESSWTEPVSADGERVSVTRHGLRIIAGDLYLSEPTLIDHPAFGLVLGQTGFGASPGMVAVPSHLESDIRALIADVQARRDRIDAEELEYDRQTDAILRAMRY